MGIKCFYLEPIGRARLSLRRYVSGSNDCRGGQLPYHNASAPLFDVDYRKAPTQRGWAYEHDGPTKPEQVSTEHTWPERCPCGYVFSDADERQVFCEALYRRTDNGEFVTLRSAPPGAMWDAEWMHDCKGGHWLGGPNADGRFLVVKLPTGHDWLVDARASNCTMPNDDTHRCWVRHGEPPNVTVDKSGVTCAAGAGSIQVPGWHGFLRNGELVE